MPFPAYICRSKCPARLWCCQPYFWPRRAVTDLLVHLCLGCGLPPPGPLPLFQRIHQTFLACPLPSSLTVSMPSPLWKTSSGNSAPGPWLQSLMLLRLSRISAPSLGSYWAGRSSASSQIMVGSRAATLLDSLSLLIQLLIGLLPHILINKMAWPADSSGPLLRVFCLCWQSLALLSNCGMRLYRLSLPARTWHLFCPW